MTTYDQTLGGMFLDCERGLLHLKPAALRKIALHAV
jgi:hypothetical protein